MTARQYKPTGVCGAATKAGGVCKRPPVQGSHRCLVHGGAKTTGVKPSAGWSTSYRNLGEQGERVLMETMERPDLLDGRRMVATIQLVINQIAFPSDDMVARVALRIARKRAADDGLDAATVVPDAVDEEEALRQLLDGSLKRFERLAAQVQAAMRTARVEALFATVVAPVVKELSTIVLDVLKEHIVNPKHRELVMNDLARKFSVWVAKTNMAATAAENA